MQKLDPKAIWLFFVPRAIGAFPAGIIIAIASMFLLNVLSPIITFLAALLLLVGIPSGIGYIWAKLYYNFYKYELREDGFRKEYGIIAKRYVTIPYERIQNVDIFRGLLARIFGLSDLRIQTAGASHIGAEGSLPGLSHEIAEQLRDELVNRSRGNKKKEV